MNFTDRILFKANKAPEGWKQKLSLIEYDSLEEDRRKYYEPLFAKYRTKKVRDYDIETGEYLGWKPIQVGIGEPIGYEYVGYFSAKLIDATLSSNVLMSRVLKKQD